VEPRWLFLPVQCRRDEVLEQPRARLLPVPDAATSLLGPGIVAPGRRARARVPPRPACPPAKRRRA
jgi:hypothetical protein